MKDNETYKYLNKYKYILIDIKALEEKLNKLNLIIYNISTNSIISYDNDRDVKDTNTDSLLHNKISELLDLKNTIDTRKIEAEKMCEEIRFFIKSSASDELGRVILERYFCDNWNMEKISVESHYSFQYIRNRFYKEIFFVDGKSKISIPATRC